MKKIICVLLSALLLCAGFATSVFAAATYTSTVGEATFTLGAAPESEFVFAMTDANLEDITKDFFNKDAFDTKTYDATYYGAYRASLTSGGENADFSADMTVSIALNESCTGKEVFLFYVTPEITISEKVYPFTREGNTVTIKGEDFEKMADRIIVVMIGEEIEPPATSPLIPALVCAAVALVAIAVTIIVVQRKKAADSIVEQE